MSKGDRQDDLKLSDLRSETRMKLARAIAALLHERSEREREQIARRGGHRD